ncbi:hypothetical protein [Staphylococcus cohnii]|uniref:hypothetical protein n=1 Tax=Staphylococcus cohnii TaxID=29382 RepID=UPI003D7E7AFF
MKKLLFTTLTTGALTLGYATVPYADAKEAENQSHGGQSTNSKVQYFSNQDLFDQLEKDGYDINDIYTKEEIKQYKAEDQLRAGKTTFVDHGNGKATLYLSSAYTKAIAWSGAAATGAISGLIGGPLGGSIGSFLGAMAGSALDTSKGVYINMETVKDAGGNYVFKGTNWGYQ